MLAGGSPWDRARRERLLDAVRALLPETLQPLAAGVTCPNPQTLVLLDANGLKPVKTIAVKDRAGKASRVSAVPLTRSSVATCPASSVMRQRMATIGSSTEPWLPESSPPSVTACGAIKVRPRPVKRRRSVS